MKSNQNLKYKLKNFRQRILKPDTIGNWGLISNKFLPMKLNQISQLFIENLELFANELLKQEDIPVLVNIVEPVNVGSDGSTQLPSVSSFEILEAGAVCMDVLELTNVDQVLGLYQASKQLKMISDIGLLWAKGEVFLLVGSELTFTLKDQVLKLVIL